MHKFATGLNFTYDKYNEYVFLYDWSRVDNSVGAFFEYTYDDNDKFSYILGGRVDYHNRLGIFVTPRLHVRYNPWEKAVFRFYYILPAIHAKRDKKKPGLILMRFVLFYDGNVPFVAGQKFPHLVGHDGAACASTQN